MKRFSIIIFFIFLASTILVSQNNPSEIYLIAKKLQNSSKYSEAAQEYEKIIKYYTSKENKIWLAAAYFELGNCYLALNNSDKAKENFNSLINYFPTHYLVAKARTQIDNIDNIIKQQKSNEENEKLKKELEEKKSKIETQAKAELMTRLNEKVQGLNEEISKTETDIKKDYEKNSELNEDNKLNKILSELTDNDLYEKINRANDLFEKRNYNQAYKLYNDLYNENKDNDLIKYNLSITLIKLERYEEAIKLLEEVYKNHTADVDTLLNLAYAYQMTNNLKLSQVLWKKVLKLDPDNKVASHNLDVLKQKYNM